MTHGDEYQSRPVDSVTLLSCSDFSSGPGGGRGFLPSRKTVVESLDAAQLAEWDK